MAKAAVEPLSVVQFLDWDSGDDRRYGLVHGVPVTMAPPSPAHDILAANGPPHR